MNGEKVVVPFRKEVGLIDPKDWITIDTAKSMWICYWGGEAARKMSYLRCAREYV